jgi:hypothetical protein
MKALQEQRAQISVLAVATARSLDEGLAKFVEESWWEKIAKAMMTTDAE